MSTRPQSDNATGAPYVSTGQLPSPDVVKALVAEAYERFKSNTEGRNSQVYPALARVPSNLFGICIVGTSGNVYAVGTILTALFLGILFARITGGFVATHLGWRWMYGLAALMLIALAPAVLARLPSSTPHSSLPYRHLLGSMLKLIGKHADLRRVVAIQLLLGICYGGFWATIANMLLNVHHLGASVAGLIGIPGAAGILIARPAGRCRGGSAPASGRGSAPSRSRRGPRAPRRRAR